VGGARRFGCLVLGVAGVGCCRILFAVEVEGITQGVHQGNAIGQQCLGGGRCCCFAGSRWCRFAHVISVPHTSTTARKRRALVSVTGGWMEFSSQHATPVLMVVLSGFRGLGSVRSPGPSR